MPEGMMLEKAGTEWREVEILFTSLDLDSTEVAVGMKGTEVTWEILVVMAGKSPRARQNLEPDYQKWVRLPLLGTSTLRFYISFLSASQGYAASLWPISLSYCPQ